MRVRSGTEKKLRGVRIKIRDSPYFVHISVFCRETKNSLQWINQKKIQQNFTSPKIPSNLLNSLDFRKYIYLHLGSFTDLKASYAMKFFLLRSD